jgi:hypothetical protein
MRANLFQAGGGGMEAPRYDKEKSEDSSLATPMPAF